MNMKAFSVALALAILLNSSSEGFHFVKAYSNGSIGFSGGVTLNSPVNNLRLYSNSKPQSR